MNSRKLYERVSAIFGATMVFFYLGLGGYIIFSSYLDHVDKALRVIIGMPLIIYGIYRVFVSYSKIRENFFEKDEE